MGSAWVSIDNYHYEATSREGFIQQLAANYLPHGYWFFLSGWVPEGKDPKAVDEKLLRLYGIPISTSARARRKQRGDANLHYLRYGRYTLLLATHGKHQFFSDHAKRVRDVRRVPIHFEDYSVTVVPGHFLRKEHPDAPPVPDGKLRVRVQIGRERLRDLRAYFTEVADRLPVDELAHSLYVLPFEPYAPVREQFLELLSVINRVRKAAGLEQVPPTVIRYQRRIVKPFAVREVANAA